MSVSAMVSALAWVSALLLAWMVAIERVKYSGFVLGIWIFFLIVGMGAGLLSYTDRK